ncbi:unnamed protein product [Haemonchus placei]|uniref:Ribonucleoside hydrolase n=1 Tax=Haemonchus placei TaxID=6290 RepID=A0A0N4WM82_HAEPC|nr:unnamed protein product [Haemonchus placei]
MTINDETVKYKNVKINGSQGENSNYLVASVSILNWDVDRFVEVLATVR